MLSRLRARLTFGNVMATFAVFVALGGSSYAALSLPKNSVGARQIKNNAVTSTEVKNRSLLARDFRAGQLPSGAKGDKGDKGDPGAPGANGSPGPALESPATESGGAAIPPGTIISAPPIPAGGAGQYLVVATANLVDSNGAGTDGQVEDLCSIEGAGGTPGGTVDVSFDDSPAFIDTEPFTVTDVRTLAVGNVVNLTCDRVFGAAGLASYQRPKITLARVAP